ncbi:RNA polymerase sigma factor [Sphingobacterium chuzhouense]|uniref:Sigma-70 family RNA polymerase sigma factor n=1 Tax=Sphingobacterium chuzhouense TaxID=1742264 RepID=A0ABR7XX38_9SPHI|nr:sigma-70 family RNA polymerase sigma factor [Sphingobacterium chuzhouense]MBD1423624.1 sigma-70 family RNA polymerase sigma factor [Sphingobacterium chuzhouense]
MSKEKSDIQIDSEIIDGIREGDNLAIQQLYQIHFPPIANMVINNRGSREEAQDIFQETVMVLYNKISDDDFVLSSRLQTFLYAISKRLWLKHLTRGEAKYRKDSIEDYGEALAAEEIIEDHEVKEANFVQMENALNGLGEPCRTILYDFYIQGQSMAAICEKFGYTNADNAKTQKYKCLQRLKKIFFKK